MEKYFVTRVEKKSWIQWPRIQCTYLFITQDKRRNKRNILHCVNSTFKLYFTCKGIKNQVWKVWFVNYTFKQVLRWSLLKQKKEKHVIEMSIKTICVWRVKFIWRKHKRVCVWKKKLAFFIHVQKPKMFCQICGEKVKEIDNFFGKCS